MVTHQGPDDGEEELGSGLINLAGFDAFRGVSRLGEACRQYVRLGKSRNDVHGAPPETPERSFYARPGTALRSFERDPPCPKLRA